MIRFLKYLGSARKSVDLCVYIFTQPVLAQVLSQLHEANVVIRIITDSSEDDTSASLTDRLMNAGIPIKSNRKGTGALMHHKFVIVDGKLLLTGSLNWTNKAVVSNYEAVIVTSQRKLVESFRAQFETMWASFSEHHRKAKKLW